MNNSFNNLPEELQIKILKMNRTLFLDELRVKMYHSQFLFYDIMCNCRIPRYTYTNRDPKQGYCEEYID